VANFTSRFAPSSSLLFTDLPASRSNHHAFVKFFAFFATFIHHFNQSLIHCHGAVQTQVNETTSKTIHNVQVP
jgi:hypothetical protein